MSQNVSCDTKIKVFELCENGDSKFQIFVDELEDDKELFDHLSGAIRIIEDTSNLIRKPKTKFRPLIDKKLPCKLYEAKYRSIRIYLFHEEKKGRVIIAGSFKKNQDKDIKKIKQLIREYYNEKNE